MAGNSVIAVCRFGGEFVTEEDGSLLYKGGEAHAMPIDDKAKYEDVKSELVEMFDCKDGKLTVKYFLPGNKKTPITISNQKDLKRMISFHSNSDTADIYVSVEELVAPKVLNVPTSRSSQTTVSEENGNLVDNAPPPVATVDETVQHIDLFGSPFSNVDDTTNMESDIDTSPVLAPSSMPLVSMDDDILKGPQKFQDSIIGVGQRFKSVDHFREALRRYSITNKFAFKYKKNERHCVTVICKEEGCPWRIHASRLPTTPLVCIKKMDGTHTCEGSAGSAGPATRSWVASVVKEKLREDPSYKPKDIVADINQEYGIKLNYSQAWRGKEIAKEQIQGSYKEAYKKLPLFCEKLMETNPGSLATFTTSEDSTFQRVFVSLRASVSGFENACRPLIFLDSVPLHQSKYQGVMFAATAVDGDNGVLPIAFSVFDSETNENWNWFLVQLKRVLLSSLNGLTIVADKEKGIKESIVEIFKDAGVHHGYCVHHLSEQLFSDLKGEFSLDMKRLIVQDFYEAAYAPNPAAFSRMLASIKNISVEAYNWVVQSEPEHWANAYFPGARYNHLTSNFGQLFYHWSSEAYEFPIVQMLDYVRGKIAELIYQRRGESELWLTRLTPAMEDALKEESSKVNSLQIQKMYGDKFDIQGEETMDIVDLDHWECSCKRWQLTGLPCCHALAAITWKKLNPYDFCARFFTTGNYRLTYSEDIRPIPSMDGFLSEKAAKSQDVVDVVTPPSNRRPPGRPPQKGSLSQESGKRKVQCGRCKGVGHNRASCKEII